MKRLRERPPRASVGNCPGGGRIGAMAAILQVLKGPNPGKSFALDGDEAVLGRNATCQVVLNVPAVSREHAVVRRVNGQYFIEDLQSRNGTFVNNQEIKART